MTQARSAGATAFGYTGGYDTSAELRSGGAQHLIDRLDELPELISTTHKQ